jgi:hypothetical protein
MLDFNSRKEQEKAALEEQKRARLRMINDANIHATAADKRRMEEQLKDQRRAEQVQFRDSILRMQEEERNRSAMDRA